MQDSGDVYVSIFMVAESWPIADSGRSYTTIVDLQIRWTAKADILQYQNLLFRFQLCCSCYVCHSSQELMVYNIRIFR
ncbi:unnamed protein product [Urochloa humidicola]